MICNIGRFFVLEGAELTEPKDYAIWEIPRSFKFLTLPTTLWLNTFSIQIHGDTKTHFINFIGLNTMSCNIMFYNSSPHFRLHLSHLTIMIKILTSHNFQPARLSLKYLVHHFIFSEKTCSHRYHYLSKARPKKDKLSNARVCNLFFKIFVGPRSILWGSLIAPIVAFVWSSPWVSKPGWFSCLNSHLHTVNLTFTSGATPAFPTNKDVHCTSLHSAGSPSRHPQCKQYRAGHDGLPTWAAVRFYLVLSVRLTYELVGFIQRLTKRNSH